MKIFTLLLLLGFCLFNYSSASSSPRAATNSPVRVPLTGCTMIDYSLPADVGASQKMSLLVDSGSTTLAVAAKDCVGCTGLSPLYAPSSTAVKVGTNDTSQFGDGTGWSGSVYKDAVSVGGLSAETPFVSIEQASTNPAFFTDNDCNGGTSGTNAMQGIMGFGGAQLANPDTVSFIDSLTAQNAASPIFAIQMCMVGGNFWLGGFDSAYTASAPVYTPFDQSQGFDEIKMTDIALTSSVYADFSGTMIVDTGTSITILPDTILQNIIAALGADEHFTSQFGSADEFFSNGNCVATTMSQSDLDKSLPSITLTLAAPTSRSGAVTVTLPATRSYLDAHEIGGKMQYCPGVIPDGNGMTPDIIGGAFMRSQIVIFDGVNKRIGFAPQQPLGTARGCAN